MAKSISLPFDPSIPLKDQCSHGIAWAAFCRECRIVSLRHSLGWMEQQVMRDRAELEHLLVTAVSAGATLLTNPHTGTPRDWRDVESDPEGKLIVKAGEPLRAADSAPAVCPDCDGVGIVRDTDTNMGGPCPACSAPAASPFNPRFDREWLSQKIASGPNIEPTAGIAPAGTWVRLVDERPGKGMAVLMRQTGSDQTPQWEWWRAADGSTQPPTS